MHLSVRHEALDETGYAVLMATSGKATLRLAMLALPDVVLLNAMMPGMGNFEVLWRPKAKPQAVPIPIVFAIGLTKTEKFSHKAFCRLNASRLQSQLRLTQQRFITLPFYDKAALPNAALLRARSTNEHSVFSADTALKYPSLLSRC